MPDNSILITEGSDSRIDTRTESTNSNHRQVIVVGDPDTNANVADVQNEDPGSGSTLQGLVVRLAGSATVVGLQGTTARPFLMNTDGAIKIYDIVNGTVTVSGNIVGITNTVAVYYDRGEPAVRAYGLEGTTSRPVRMNSDGAVKIYDLVNGTVNINTALPAGGNIIGFVNQSSTAVIPSTVSNSTSAVSTSGETVVSPEASRVIKVYAFSLTTTAQVQITARFTNGSGASPTEFWRVALQAQSSGISGANLAVTPPGYLFATAANTTLALRLDSASLVHYSVAYFKESG